MKLEESRLIFSADFIGTIGSYETFLSTVDISPGTKIPFLVHYTIEIIGFTLFDSNVYKKKSLKMKVNKS